MALSVESAKKRIVQILTEEGAGAGSSIHSWRCTFPAGRAPCDCLEQLADRIINEVYLAGPQPDTTNA